MKNTLTSDMKDNLHIHRLNLFLHIVFILQSLYCHFVSIFHNSINFTFRRSLVSISLIYHRRDRTVHPSHTQSFVLCDIDETRPFNGIGQCENILESRHGGFNYWTGSLKPGSYILIPFSISFWDQALKDNKYTIVIHSSTCIESTMIVEPPTMLTDCLISAVVKKYYILRKVC